MAARGTDPAYPSPRPGLFNRGLTIRQLAGMKFMAALLSDPSIDGDPKQLAQSAADYADSYITYFVDGGHK